MAFQKCPTCNGSGQVFDPLSSTTTQPCHVCNGWGIIDEMTGRPPEGKKEKLSKENFSLKRG